MWKTKTWKLADKEKYTDWLKKNKDRFQITTLFINNGYGVEYKSH